MKYELFSKPDGGFEADIYDDQKMIPDPNYRRIFQWHGAPPLAPRGADESEADFETRAAAAAPELEKYLENIRAESIRLYRAEFEEKPAARVLTGESTF